MQDQKLATINFTLRTCAWWKSEQDVCSSKWIYYFAYARLNLIHLDDLYHTLLIDGILLRWKVHLGNYSDAFHWEYCKRAVLWISSPAGLLQHWSETGPASQSRAWLHWRLRLFHQAMAGRNYSLPCFLVWLFIFFRRSFSVQKSFQISISQLFSEANSCT